MQSDIDLQVLKVVVAKLDETLEKISESTNTIGKLLAVHDGRINSLEKDTEDTNKEIKDLYTKMETNTKDILKEISDVEIRIENKLERASDQSCEQHKSLSSKVDGLNTRLEDLEKWKWYISSAIVIITFIISNKDILLRMFS
jgi:predicted  nucleic acid-binding Zn-ribbon protein